jgi:hypothetical protein
LFEAVNGLWGEWVAAPHAHARAHANTTATSAGCVRVSQPAEASTALASNHRQAMVIKSLKILAGICAFIVLVSVIATTSLPSVPAVQPRTPGWFSYLDKNYFDISSVCSGRVARNLKINADNLTSSIERSGMLSLSTDIKNILNLYKLESFVGGYSKYLK